MAQLTTERSAYVKSNQKYVADLKVSQFAKFLDKNPIYVTYYPILQAQSSTDNGTGNIYEEIGPNSPVRFNKILNLPAFNIPELKPDVVNDEAGYSIELDITDIAFIGGTVRPKPGDYMRLDIPGAVPLLFRCHDYRHNTIKSNDYYMGDFDLVDANQKYIKLIEKQVDTELTCRFENIGSNQKVFVTEAEATTADELDSFIDSMVQFYNDAFYNDQVDGFVLYNAQGSTGLNGNGGPESFGTQWYYDNYVTRFINESQIFETSDDHTVVLPYLELLPFNFDLMYRATVYFAVLQDSNQFMRPYLYAWNMMIQKRTSPFNLGCIPCVHPSLQLFDHYVKPQEDTPDHLKGKVWTPGEPCGFNGADPRLRTYFSYELVESCRNGKPLTLNPIESIIYQYITAGIKNVTYRKEDLINFMYQQDLFTYMHMPILIYIMKQYRASLLASS